MRHPNDGRTGGDGLRERASTDDLTRFLNDLDSGRLDTAETLMPHIYGELLAIAERQMRRERVGHTLQPTELVNEAFLRLFKPEQVSWNDRRHFYTLAARAMRQLLVDHARRRKRLKRGEGNRGQTLARPSWRGARSGSTCST